MAVEPTNPVQMVTGKFIHPRIKRDCIVAVPPQIHQSTNQPTLTPITALGQRSAVCPGNADHHLQYPRLRLQQRGETMDMDICRMKVKIFSRHKQASKPNKSG